jgi:excisionase family DNA binding protein
MNPTFALIDTDQFFQRLEDLISRKFSEAQQAAELKAALPELLSRAQAAEFLNVSRGTIDNLARAGLLQKHYLGSVPRFKREELLAAFEGWKKFQRL